MIRGIGPVYAKKLLRAFGDKVFDVIEAEPDRLREVDGIGPIRAGRIIAAWAEQKAVREIMVFLHSHGVGTAWAVRIYKTYGGDAVQVMSQNPYRLARDIRGSGNEQLTSGARQRSGGASPQPLERRNTKVRVDLDNTTSRLGCAREPWRWPAWRRLSRNLPRRGELVAQGKARDARAGAAADRKMGA